MNEEEKKIVALAWLRGDGTICNWNGSHELYDQRWSFDDIALMRAACAIKALDEYRKGQTK